MDLLGPFCLFSRAKSVISSLSAGIILWTTGSSSPMQTLNGYFPPDHLDQHLQLGLKTLIHTQPDHQSPAIADHHPEIIHSYNVKTNSSSSPPWAAGLLFSPPPLILDDLIGTDSGVHNMIMSLSYEQRISDQSHKGWNNGRERAAKRERHYPPPIPLLAQTGNLAGRMPWILTRDYSDGRLLLNVQRVQHHEYFKAHRENGRLILILVTIEDTTSSNSTRYCDDDDDDDDDQDQEQEFEDAVEAQQSSSPPPLQFFEEEEEDRDYDKFIESETEDRDRWMNGDDDEIISSTDDHVMALESVLSHELSYLENAISTTRYACGMLMDSILVCNASSFHERSHLYSFQQSASPLRPMTTVIM
ncbi:The fantastic four family [Parasponia andersonii]|uniref:The fantastic four family n=1 Tax=Parasponia andersonii TaxID=3476 RepID=A0A2P5CR08_PARAD|nr:The fantastic four family [Parasponia andersonii]